MKTVSGDPYRIINLVFALIIISVFLYSWYYGFPGRVHPVPSVSGWLTGKESVSTGLSRSFSAIIHFRFREARSYNPHGVRIFIFFLIQLLMRLTGLFMHGITSRNIILSDITISFLFFIISFWPFLMSLHSL